MAFTLTIPELGEKPGTVRDMVMACLLAKHPQTTKQLFNSISKRYGVKPTFQAVNKSVKSLIVDKVLRKEGRELRISHEWVFHMRDFVEQLLKCAFEARAERKEQIGEDVVEYAFENMLDCDKFVAYLTIAWAEHLKPGDERTVVWQGMHCWWLIGQLGSEDWYVEALKKHTVTSCYYNHGKTLLDSVLSKKYYESVGWKFKHSDEKNPDIRHNMAVFGDIILQSYYPEEIAKSIDTFYNKVTDISKMNPAELIRILREPRKITLTFLRNPVLAKKIKEDILQKFKE